MTALPRASNKRPGRPRVCDDDTLVMVVRLRDERKTLLQICEILNADKIPTPGRRSEWKIKTVYDLLHTIDAEHVRDGRPVGGRRSCE